MIRDREPMERLLGETAWLRRLARSLVRGHDVAEDVVQETLLRAVAAPAATIGNLRGWLGAVAANVARRFRRDAVREGRRRQALPLRDAEPSVAEAVARTEAQQRVMAALLAMAEPYRSVLLLRFQGGLGYAAIAARLDVPIETVRTQIKRGLQRLRDELDGRPGGRAAWGAAVVAFPRAAAILLAGGAVTAGAAAIVVAWLAVSSPVDGEAVALAPRCEAAVPVPLPIHAVVAGVEREPVQPPAVMRAAAASAAVEPAELLLPTKVSGWRGRVLDAVTRLPVAGAAVCRGDRFVRFDPAPEESAACFTDREGWYTLEDAAEGGSFSELTVRARGYAPKSAFLEGLTLSPARRAEAALSSDPASAANGRRFADLLLDPAQFTEVVVRTANGERAMAAEVFTSSTAVRRRWSEALGSCDASGVWQGVLPRHQGATTFLVAIHDGAIGAVPASPGTRHMVQLGAVGDLRLRIVDEDGAPLPGAFVCVEPEAAWVGDHLPGLAAGSLWTRLRRSGQADAHGEVTLRGVPLLPDERSCRLLAFCSGHRGEHRVQAVPAAGAWVRVVLPRGTLDLVHGRVVDAETREPIARAMVGNAVTTGLDGRFGCPDTNLAAGRVRLDVAAPGYVPLLVDEPVAGRAGAIAVDVALVRAVPCRGRVLDDRGNGIAGVHLARPGGRSAETAADGSFELLDVPVGRVRLQLEKPGCPGFPEPCVAEIDTGAPPCVILVAAGRDR